MSNVFYGHLAKLTALGMKDLLYLRLIDVNCNLKLTIRIKKKILFMKLIYILINCYLNTD